MRDLLIITPTRGRPDGAMRLVNAVLRTATAETDLYFGVDDDDGAYEGCWPTYQRLDGSYGFRMLRGPRQNCAEWSNAIAAEFADQYRYVASLSDDHLPVTPGWDSRLIAAIEDMGGTGIAYGNDLLQGGNLPTAPLMSSDIVQSLGWMFCPPMTRLFCDNVWKDLGEQAGCLAYQPDVIIRHLHYTAARSSRDQTAIDNEGAWAHDEAAYHVWQRDRMAGDVATIRKLREASCLR